MPKRIVIESDSRLHFVTFSVHKHIPVFKNYLLANEFVDNLRFYFDRDACQLHGFVIMPDHVHLLLELSEGRKLPDFIRDIKKFFSYKVKDSLLNKTGFDAGIFNQKDTFQFWTRGYDEVTIFSERIFRIKLEYIHNNPVKAGLVEKAEDYLYSSAKHYILGTESVL